MHDEAWITERLCDLSKRHLDRHVQAYMEAGGKIRIGKRTYLNFSSNDYLNLARHPDVVKKASQALRITGCGAAASRLLTGTLTWHDELEQRLARYKGYPCALLFGSGFLANVGTIPALMGRNDYVFADKLVHASIVDAVMLSRAKLYRFRHNDVEHLEQLLKKSKTSGRRLVVTESVFGMDGDLAPLQDIAHVAQRHGAMVMVDEAHATGVFGPKGGGLVREWGLESMINIDLGTLSKAFGGYGGFVSCSQSMRAFLINRARSFIYSTALPPSVVGAALGALQVTEESCDLGSQLLQNAAAFRNRLEESGLKTGNSASQIVPIMVGQNSKVLTISQKLREQGIIGVAIRPPTVPRGTARIRLSVTLAHSKRDLEHAGRVIIAIARNEGLL
ncbi:MAG TPA: 8-amino-7-oxononanoate synthase [Desulfobacterales bacterium]|nr:8-amino-7-oxononanoate synthase [Desulfobacterales bacterium]